MIKKLCNKNTTQAKVVDGKLILSCPGALTPVVWQMDLASAKNAAFEVKTDDSNKNILLISRQPDNKKEETIAPFSKKEDAVNALMATSRALENAHGQIMTAAPANTDGATPAPMAHHYAPPRKTNWGKVAIGTMGVIIIIVMFTMIQNMKNNGPTSVGQYGASSSTAGASTEAQSQSGVPMSADDFLRQN